MVLQVSGRIDDSMVSAGIMISLLKPLPPNTSLEPTADAAPNHMSIDSSIEFGVSLPRLSRLWLSSIR